MAEAAGGLYNGVGAACARRVRACRMNDFRRTTRPPDPSSAFAPLHHAHFRALWIATVASNIGTWMQDVGAAWLMTTLAPSPVMVALVRAASALPMFALALPAGALADVVDRRRLLLITQTWMLVSAALLAALTLAGFTTPGWLLALTAALAVGTALNAPAWQAIIPELVPRAQVASAVALNSTSINLARSVGPALGGLLIAATGPGATFALNALSFGGVIYVLYRWRRTPQPSVLPAERVLGAMRAGLRYVRHSPALLAILARETAFILCASSLWALLPALARFEFGRGPAGYGVLLGFFGAGAVTVAALLPRVRRRAPIDTVVALAVLVFAVALAALAWVPHIGLADLLLFVAGGAWLTLLSTFNAGIQAIVPSWVRGRAFAVSVLTFFGGMTLGSVLWGSVAEWLGLRPALMIAAAGTLLGLALTRRLRLPAGEALDLSPSVQRAEPEHAYGVPPEHGPVVVTVEYRIDPARLREFTRAMGRVRRIRRRDGAISWALLADVAESGRYTETFVVESWLEHLRQHERVTVADRALLDKARGFHLGNEPPRVTHYVVEPLGGRGARAGSKPRR